MQSEYPRFKYLRETKLAWNGKKIPATYVSVLGRLTVLFFTFNDNIASA